MVDCNPHRSLSRAPASTTGTGLTQFARSEDFLTSAVQPAPVLLLDILVAAIYAADNRLLTETSVFAFNSHSSAVPMGLASVKSKRRPSIRCQVACSGATAGRYLVTVFAADTRENVTQPKFVLEG